MSLLIKPEPFTREVDRLFDRLFDDPHGRPAVGTGHGPRRGGGPLPAPGRPAGRVRGGRLDRGRQRRSHPRRRAQGRARAQRAWLLPRRARVRPLPAPADAAGGRRHGRGHGRVRQGRADRPDPQARAGSSRAGSPSAAASRPPWRAPPPRSRQDQGRMALFDIDAREGSARAGVLRLAHGEVRTPAFVPLASNACVRGLAAPEVAALGYEMVLGNTFHLFITPGHEQIAADGRSARVHGLGAADHHRLRWLPGVLAWATDRWPRRSSAAAAPRTAGSWRSRRRASPSAPTSTAPSGSWGRRPRWRCRRRWAPTSRWRSTSAPRSTCDRATRCARWSARTAGWTAAWPGRASTAAPTRCCTGSSRAAWTASCGPSPAPTSPRAGVDGIAIGGSLGQDKEQMREVLGWSLARPARDAPAPPAGHRRRGRHRPRGRQGIDTFDCATPTRLARHGTALVPDPERRWRLDLTKSEWRDEPRPLVEGCPCPACREHTRGYLHYLAAQGTHRRAADHAAQPDVHGGADARHPGGDRAGEFLGAERDPDGAGPGDRSVAAGELSRRAYPTGGGGH